MTKERLFDPQRINLYAYVTNNPLLFVDETGKDLTVSGNTEEAVNILRQILGTKDASSRINYDSEKGLSINLKDIDLTKNEGAQLLYDLTASGKTYQLLIGETVETATGTVPIGDINNLPESTENGSKPANGVDGMVAIDPERDNMISVNSGVNLEKPPLWTTAFHELAESYEKVDKGNTNYEAPKGSHNTAIDREVALRSQRPELNKYVFGGGSRRGPGEKSTFTIDGGKLTKHKKEVQKRINENKKRQ